MWMRKSESIQRRQPQNVAWILMIFAIASISFHTIYLNRNGKNVSQFTAEVSVSAASSSIQPAAIKEPVNNWTIEEGKSILLREIHVSKFDEFFDSEKVNKFRRNHIQKCHENRPSFNGLLYSNLFLAGFGSVLDNALNAYVISIQPKINRTFQLLHYRWPYTPPGRLFIDFTENSSCPLFPTVSDQTIEQLQKSSQQTTLSFNNITQEIDLAGPAHIAPTFGLESRQVSQTLRHLLCAKGNAAVHRPKGEFLRALWNLLPDLKLLIRQLWNHLVSNSTTGYFGVHIRRGDKISTGEMKLISLSRYARNLTEWCVVLKEKCPRSVFVASDDPKAVEKMRMRLGKNFTVTGLSELIRISGLNEEDYIVQLYGKSPYTLQGYRLSREKWDIHTRELVIMMTLLAMSDNLLCTISSNICRLLALMRFETMEMSLRSLDLQEIQSC